jgi:DNA polymerase-1
MTTHAVTEAPVPTVPVHALLEVVMASGAARGQPIAVAVSGAGLGLWWGSGGCGVEASPDVAVPALAAVEHRLRPRWVWWASGSSAPLLLRHGLRVALCWDVAAVHRLLVGGADDDPAVVWATLAGLEPADVPRTGQLDLLGPTGADDSSSDVEQPVLPGGHLRAEWAEGGWARTPARLARWAALAWTARQHQVARLTDVRCTGDAPATALSESAAELLCAELQHDGLPVDRACAERLVTRACGERPRDADHETALRRARDRLVLRHLPPTAPSVDLRNPAQVRAGLAAVGIDVPDTRSGRLEPWRDQHPFVDALLLWRKADRIATTYGYRWLDAHVGPDDRLRGDWSGSDGAAGRMTAQAGLHNLPTELRPAIAAQAGHLLVRADLGQVEPRVLAAVSGDPALAAATEDDDLYLPVAARLRVDRSIAKVAVLAAMYGQTSGTAGQALQAMERAYPVALRYLRLAYDSGREGRPVRTHGGRLVRMYPISTSMDDGAHRAALNARGRFARNAVVQGSAAELFKAWAATVRSRCRPLGAQIVLCLHDELLVHAPEPVAQDVATLLRESLTAVGARWAPPAAHGRPVRFVADVAVVRRWSEAKE